MRIETLVVGALQTNCYVVWDELEKKAVILDPGGDAGMILDTVGRLGVHVTHVINTHGHFDHIGANAEVLRSTGAELAIHPDDVDMLSNPLRSFGILMGQFKTSPRPTILLSEDSTIQVGATPLQILHTPGHSPGSVSLWSQQDGVVFCGDVLFRMGIGRTDFPGGNRRTLLSSIRIKLFALPDDVMVYPGHGPTTTIGFERENNPFLA